MKRKTDIILVLFKLAADCIVIYFSFILAYIIRFKFAVVPVTKGIPPIENYIHIIPLVITVYIVALKWQRLYDDHKILYKTDEFLSVLRASFIASVIIIAATFIYREFSYSRLVMLYAFSLNFIFLYIVHRIFRLLRMRIFKGKLGIIVIGGKKIKDKLLKNISKRKEFHLHFIRHLDIEEIKNCIKNKKVQEIVLADLDVEKTEILKLISFCEEKNIEFKMVPDILELKMGEMNYDSYFGIPVLELKHPLFEPTNYYMKRGFDIIVSMLMLFTLSPLLLLVVIAIKFDSAGPVIYSHLRKGFKGKEFKFYKFRSMIINADEKLNELLKFNERRGSAFKMKNDPRVTKIGKFIRKYSIDEIPQLINVLKGDMSLVGPRPQVIWEADSYDDTAKRRLNVLPGITGLWQISGRSELSFEEMIRLDLYYLENWSPGFDIKILLKTIPVVLLKKGAY